MTILALIASVELVEADTVILERAAQPMPTEIGPLDAHSPGLRASLEGGHGSRPSLATHAAALGLAAQTHGRRVLRT